MAGWIPNQHMKGNIVEQKIKRLTTGDEHKNLQRCSPSWRELQNGNHRVKKLSRLFEEKTKGSNLKTVNWWLEEKVQQKELAEARTPTKPRVSLGRIHGRVNSSPIKIITKLDRIIAELLQKEASYIQTLERGIDYYVSDIKEGSMNVPAPLRQQTFRLFGNIEEIFKLHRDSVYPRLMICNNNARLIADTITSFIQNDLFYHYVIYAINQKSAEQLAVANSEFFEALRSTSDDLLGIHSFLIQPIQKLPRYKMFFDEMIKELSRDLPFNKEALAACCVAEKNVQRLLTRLNEALSINDIIETHEYSASVQMGLLTTIQHDYGVSLSEPMMLLVPKSSSHFPFRSPVNVYSLGKFVKCSELKAFEFATNRSFPSKVFIFEKCLLYTKLISNFMLGYRNHYGFRSGFAFITQESQVSIKVCGVNKKQDVIFSSDNIESIAVIKKLVNNYYGPRRSADSAFVDGHELLTITEEQEFMSEDDEWVVSECDFNEFNQDEHVNIANSRFYVKSPEPASMS